MPTLIRHGAYGAESLYEVVQLRYGSTDCEDTNQGYVELLEVRDGPPQLGKYVVHMYMSWPDEKRHEHIVVTLRHLTDAEEAYKAVSKMSLLPRSMRPRKIAGEPVEYLEGRKIPWIYGPRLPEQLPLL